MSKSDNKAEKNNKREKNAQKSGKQANRDECKHIEDAANVLPV